MAISRSVGIGAYGFVPMGLPVQTMLVPVGKTNKLLNLVSRPQVIHGNPNDLVDISWEEEVSLDLH